MECLKPLDLAIVGKVPCGKCAFCLVNKRSQWMFRIFYEMKFQEHPGWFLTLTYEERFVKRVADGRLSLRFRDVQLFLKKLRKAGYYAKYICVGEYGSATARPHYHMLLWTDCAVCELESFWSIRDGRILGRIHVGRITMQSAMYTLKYIIQPKQVAGEGIERTRAQFSKGLGLAYLDTAVYDYHTSDYDSPMFMSVVDGQRVALPRYYKFKIFTKFQMRREAARCRYVKMKEETKVYRALRKRGVRNIRPYLKALRVESAARIISSTKFSEIL